MPEFIITYENLYEIFRKEKYKPELQNLNKNFFENVIKYLAEKNSILESQKSKKSVFAPSEIQKTKKQLQNVKKILKELYERRENKIIQLALFSSKMKEKQDLSAMLPEERRLYQELIKRLSTSRKDILFNLLSAKLPSLEKTKDIKTEEKEKNSTKLVRFLHSTPKFVGDDLNTYGPYENEDIGNLPLKVAEVLIKSKRAEEIQTK